MKKVDVVSIITNRRSIEISIYTELFTLPTELLYLQEFQSVEHFTKELIEYLDYYNNRRIKQKLKGLSPVKYRTQSSQVA